MSIIAVLTASNYVLINECGFLTLTVCLAILVFTLYLAWLLNGDTLVFGGLIFSLILGSCPYYMSLFLCAMSSPWLYTLVGVLIYFLGDFALYIVTVKMRGAALISVRFLTWLNYIVTLFQAFFFTTFVLYNLSDLFLNVLTNVYKGIIFMFICVLNL